MASLREKLARTRQAFRQKFEDILKSGRSREEILEDLTETLILADIGLPTAEKIVEAVGREARKSDGPDVVRDALKAEILAILTRHPGGLKLDPKAGVLMMVGVNGGGKTTSLAKLARRLKAEGRKSIFVAGDTFRAAAQEQLAVWGRKLDLPVIKGAYGADPASVAFDACRRLKTGEFDAMLVDTAGRIHTNANLMAELEKVKRVIAREIPGAPQEILLVLDASIGQNALPQAREFLKFAGLTGVFLSKLDGTAKGGSVVTIADELGLPIKFAGTGEGEDDLVEFSAESFVDALFS
jgi:fused signal recognition particle receptor